MRRRPAALGRALQALDRAGLTHRDLLASARPEPDRAGVVQAQDAAADGRRPLEEALEAALGPALATITAHDARGWFRRAGYPAAD